jgi:preprotein translocase subunit SecE
MAENAVEEEEKKSRRRRREERNATNATTNEDAQEEDASYTVGKGRATPGRRNQEDEKEEGNVVTRSFGGIREYFSDVRSELDKVSWPTREDALRLTRVVLITLLLSAIIMGGISFLFARYVEFGIRTPFAFVALLIVVVGVAFWYFRRENSTGRGY